jgi:hypothetical protein
LADFHGLSLQVKDRLHRTFRLAALHNVASMCGGIEYLHAASISGTMMTLPTTHYQR